MRRRRHHTGFTLIELLVVISIIGLIATLASVALKNSRVKSRDTKRLGDMKQLHTALEVCHDANGGSYTTPTACCTLAVGANNIYQCTGALLTTYLTNIANLKDPSNITNPSDDCPNTPTADTCEYTITGITGNTYTVRFYLEGNGGENKTMTPAGIQ